MKYKADVEIPRRSGTALIVAARWGHTEVFKNLVEKGKASVNVVSGVTKPLGAAHKRVSVAVVEILLRSGAVWEGTGHTEETWEGNKKSFGTY